MNFGEMVTEVRDIIGERAEDFWTDLELKRHLNEAQRIFLRSARWPWLVTAGTGQVLAGDDELELPEGVAVNRAVAVYITSSTLARSEQMHRVQAEEGFHIASRYAEDYTATVPEAYYVTRAGSVNSDGKYTYVIKFVPPFTNDTDISFQYSRAITVMSGSTDYPDIPEEFHKGLVHYAAGLAWQKELNGERKASAQFGLYADAVNDARKEWLELPDDDLLIMGQENSEYTMDPSRYSDPWLERIPDTLGP